MEANSCYNSNIRKTLEEQYPYISSKTSDMVDTIYVLAEDMEEGIGILKDLILEFRISECGRILADIIDAFSAIELSLDKIRRFFNEQRLMTDGAWFMVALAVMKQCYEEREYGRLYEVIIRSAEPAFNGWKNEIHRVLKRNVSM
mgnify:CR=1 FL=1